MGYADLISSMQVLPKDKQAEVFDFVEFLVQRNRAVQKPAPTLAQTSLVHWISDPVVVPNFKPFTRDEANAR
jgi:hypothetical protein